MANTQVSFHFQLIASTFAHKISVLPTNKKTTNVRPTCHIGPLPNVQLSLHQNPHCLLCKRGIISRARRFRCPRGRVTFSWRFRAAHDLGLLVANPGRNMTSAPGGLEIVVKTLRRRFISLFTVGRWYIEFPLPVSQLTCVSLVLISGSGSGKLTWCTCFSKRCYFDIGRKWHFKINVWMFYQMWKGKFVPYIK